MRVATITEAKDGLSALIDHVRGGESVTIVDRGIPVARLESAVAVGDGDGKLARLERRGAVRVAAEGDPASLDVVSLDDRLVEAAEREGFTVLGRPADRLNRRP